MKTYIHYGASKYNDQILKDQIDELVASNYKQIRLTGKPVGLYSSPVNTKWGWKDFCECEDFHTDCLDKYFKFTLSENAKILNVNTEYDIIPYIISYEYKETFDPLISADFRNITDCCDRIDQKKLMEEYDGMELYMDKNWDQLRYSMFYTWDVDTLVVWNPDIIKEVS